jgi:hypothetical protein
MNTITKIVHRYYNKHNAIVIVLVEGMHDAKTFAKYDKMMDRYGWTKTIKTETYEAGGHYENSDNLAIWGKADWNNR